MLFITKMSETINFTAQLFTKKKKKKMCTHVKTVDNLFEPIATVHSIIYTYEVVDVHVGL